VSVRPKVYMVRLHLTGTQCKSSSRNLRKNCIDSVVGMEKNTQVLIALTKDQEQFLGVLHEPHQSNQLSKRSKQGLCQKGLPQPGTMQKQ